MDLLTVRQATKKDLPMIQEVGTAVWTPLGIPCEASEIEGWFENKSPFFLVAELNNKVVGYSYAKCVNFSLENIEAFLNPKIFSGTGDIKLSHDPMANSVYWGSVGSKIPGVGKILKKEFTKRIRQLNKHCYFGYSRISGFSAYIASLSKEELKQVEEYGEYIVAQWYTQECIQLITDKTWKRWPFLPTLNLPTPPKDPILTYHIRETNFDLIDVVPNFMSDSESKNFTALFMSQEKSIFIPENNELPLTAAAI